MAQFRRSIFLINKPFQLKFSLYVCSFLIALSFVYPLIVYTLFDYFIRYLSQDPNGPPLEGLLATRDQILVLLLSLQGLFLGICFLISVFMSHRIAGPLFKLSQFFERAKKGDLQSELRFRDRDHFQELAKDFNEMTRSIRVRQEAASQELIQALKTLPADSSNVRISLEKAIALLQNQPLP